MLKRKQTKKRTSKKQKKLFLPKFTLGSGIYTLTGDKFRFQQLFQNLISNEIKYNDKNNGYVTISVKESGKNHLFSIADNGMGIPKKYHDRIFKVFETLGKKNDNSTGIGLSIVKKIIHHYQGKIWVESSLNSGTTFFFELQKGRQ